MDPFGINMFQAIQDFDLQRVSDLLREPAIEVDVRNLTGYTPLAYAVQRGFFPAVSLLIERQANIDELNHRNMSPLATAVEELNFFTVSLLLQAKATLNPIDPESMSPICFAVMRNSLAMTKFLLSKNADVNCVDPHTQVSPIFYAIENRASLMVSLLLEACAKPNDFMPDTFETPLHFAARCGDETITSLLLDSKADVNLTTASGDTPLHFAVVHSDIVIPNLLYLHGADILILNNEGKIAEERALQNSLAGVMLKRIRTSYELMTPLYRAVVLNDIAKVRAIIKASTNLQRTCNMAISIFESELYRLTSSERAMVLFFVQEQESVSFRQFLTHGKNVCKFRETELECIIQYSVSSELQIL